MVLLSLVTSLPAAQAQIECDHQGSPWFTLNVKAELEGVGPNIPWLSFGSYQVSYLASGNSRLSTLYHTGNDPVVILEPLETDFQQQLQQRVAWANAFETKFKSIGMEVFQKEASREGAFTDESSIKFFADNFQARPAIKLQKDANPRSSSYYESVAVGAIKERRSI